VREFLKSIDEETDRLEHIVDNLTDLSQIESGRLRLNKQPCDLAKLAREVSQGIGIQAPQHDVRHSFAEPLMANVDRARIEQVLRNLLSNAIKYSPGGGVIEVRAHKEQHQVTLQVSDQGIGIAPQHQERIFERFYRVENEVTQSERGVGLGLAICQRIIEAHGGRIWVESVLGQGSTFYVALPIDPESAVYPAPQVPAPAFAENG
jgi:signal transduction histidine kinase